MKGRFRTPKRFAAGKKIIVAGAGISSLSFVIALRKQWASHCPSEIPPTVALYERDTKEVGIERQGYSFSIRSDSYSGGMQVLSKLGLLDSMLRASVTGIHEEPGAFVIWDTNWNKILRLKQKPEPDLPTPVMRIARNVLRRLLVEAATSSDSIQWGTTCTGVSRLNDGRVQVQLSNGQTDECDLLIVADGANSKIRSSIRPEEKLSFTGAVCIAGTAKFASDVPSPVNRDWGLLLGGAGTGLFVSPVDQHSALWSVSYLASEPRQITKPLSSEQVELLLHEALDRGKPFA